MDIRYQTPQANEQGREAHAALDYALRYAREGVRVIWIPRGTKKPIAKDWPNVASCDPEVIKRWAAKHPGCNFGLAMGGGVIAIDVDDPRVLAQGVMPYLPETRLHETPGGGLHFLYAVAEDVAIKNTVGVFPHVDIRYKGAQIVAPGSVHPNGGVYKLAADLPIAPLPDEWLAELVKPERKQSAPPAAGKDAIPQGKRNVTLFQLAASMRRRGTSEDAIRAALHEENKRCAPPLDDKDVETIARSGASYPPNADIQKALNSERPKVLLPGDDRLMSDVAGELAKYLRDSLFVHNDEVVRINGDKLHVIGAQEFRTFAEKSIVGLRMRSGGLKFATMSDNEARGLLASPQLCGGLRTVARVNTQRKPVLRENGRVELLPEGYDDATHTFTRSGVAYAEDMPLDAAVAVLRDLFHEFTFSDPGRSLSVAVAAMVGMYAAQLISESDSRPSFVVNKNAEGAGATILTACCIVPTLGYMPTSVMPRDDEEMRKKITATVREAANALVLDNTKGRIDSQPLEAFISAPGNIWSDRLLGSNDIFSGVNYATVFCTANGARTSPDMRRRSLLIELHLFEEHAEDKVYKRKLSVKVIKTMSPALLAACWSLVRNWDEKRRPEPSRSHSAFPEWARVVGGIVEAAGFGCPLETPESKDAVDQDGEDMRALVEAMTPGRKYKLHDLAALCYTAEIFTGLTGNHAIGMTLEQSQAFGYLLKHYDDRRVGGFEFFIEGKGHARRFHVHPTV